MMRNSVLPELSTTCTGFAAKYLRQSQPVKKNTTKLSKSSAWYPLQRPGDQRPQFSAKNSC